MLQKHTHHNRLFPGSTEISGGTVKASGEATIMGLTPAQYIEQFARWGVTPAFASRVMRTLHYSQTHPDSSYDNMQRKYAVDVPASEGMEGWSDSGRGGAFAVRTAREHLGQG
jgi:hypothetical protein